MASEVSICNSALILLGRETITALTDDVKAARLCNAVFDMKRDWLLRAHIWKFATARETLALLSATPDFEYSYKHQLPSDFLRLISVYDSSVRYRIEGDTLLSDETVMKIKYIKRVTNPNSMDPTFRETLAALIAKDICKALTDDDSLHRAMKAEFDDRLMIAQSTGAMEDDNDEIEADDWLSHRY